MTRQTHLGRYTLERRPHCKPVDKVRGVGIRTRIGDLAVLASITCTRTWLAFALDFPAPVARWAALSDMTTTQTCWTRTPGAALDTSLLADTRFAGTVAIVLGVGDTELLVGGGGHDLRKEVVRERRGSLKRRWSL